VLFHVAQELFTGSDTFALTRGLNLSLAMIQKDYGGYVVVSVGEELLSGRFAQEAVIYIVRVGVNSGHGPVRGNGPPRTEVPRNVEFDNGAELIAHKSVIHVCTVNIPSRGCSIRIDIPRERTLVEARTGMRSIENCNRAMLIQQEAVIHEIRVNEDSQDGSVRSKATAIRTLAGARASARKIECGNDAPLIPQEAVDRIGPVKVESCDLSLWADCETLRALVSSCACTRRIERRDNAIVIAHETVKRAHRVSIKSRARPVRVDELGAVKRKGALPRPRACARRVEYGNHALIGTNVAVGHIRGVSEVSCNRPTRVD
jgi:hypothetical protein